ncbi:MAG: hypothetical protein HY973_01870 [Candidatus Kerfeldbacteria bacterium]|nr:hypothetical protein [Candidatus Kerfeldbacteria bacterium]
MFMVNSGLVLLFFKMENVDVNAEPEKLIGPVLLIVVSLFLNYKLRIHCRKKDNYSWKRAAVNFAYNFFTILGLICLAYWDGKINYYIVAYALLISYFFINSTFEFGKKETVNDFGK